MIVVYGIAGTRDYDGHLSFTPRLPAQLQRLRFPLMIHGQRLEVDIGKVTATYLLCEGSELVITHQGETVRLTAGTPVSKPL